MPKYDLPAVHRAGTRKGIDIALANLELFDVLKRRAKIKPIGRFAKDLPQRIQNKSATVAKQICRENCSMKKACPFCAPPAERVSASDEFAFTLRDGFPISPGHTLIIPIRHIRSWFEATDLEQTSMLMQLKAAKDKLDADIRPDGYNIGINDGDAAGQTVPHLHMHLIPRFRGDVSDPRGGVRWVIADKADYWSDRP